MANLLDEMNEENNLDKGNDIKVIGKQISPKIGFGSYFFVFLLFFPLIIPGLIYLFKRIKAKNELLKLEQKIQKAASTVDNFLESRVTKLSNLAALVTKSVNLDKETMTEIARLRSNGQNGQTTENKDLERQNLNTVIENVASKIDVAFERYPELKAHETIQQAMQENNYSQSEITAARENYNETVLIWNKRLFQWPTYQIVAARNKFTTRIQFATSKEIKQKAKEVFF